MINGFEDEQIEVDFCNEYLAINILERKSILTFSNFGKAVIRIQLNRTKLNDLDNRFFHSHEILVENWSSDLPGLKKGQNDPEADAEQDTKKNAGETLDVHDEESNPKRFKN